MANEVYNTLRITGTHEAVSRFRQTPFPPTGYWIEDLRDDAGKFAYHCYSKWTPPYDWLDKVVAEFPELTFRGSATNDQDEWYATFEGREGHLTWTEGSYKEAFGEE
jgi:hypothetical protein